MKTTRVESIDWLRGLMAVSIMVFHLTWRFIRPLDSNDFVGRLGIYGVSVFFILSGLSIAVAYSQFINNTRSSLLFIIRRIFRIWPLFWVCTILSILQKNTTQANNSSLDVILLNVSTTFGFIRPDAYISMGAWSIGSEMVYYALTPIILVLYSKKKILGDSCLIISCLAMLVFCFFLIKSKESLVKPEQWRVYINPLNNLFLYLSGISMYYNMKDAAVKPSMVIISIATSVIFFVWYPVSGNLINIVTGFNRILFVTASILMVISFYKFSFYDKVPLFISAPLQQFGLATYGVYMLHPLVMDFFLKLGINEPKLIFTTTIVATVVLSLLSYHFFEIKIMNLCKNMFKVQG